MTKCAECSETGGRFVLRGDRWVHVKCSAAPKIRNRAGSMFPYESMHLSSDPNLGPVKIESLPHLRRLEKEHGVSSAAFNDNQSNW